MSQRINFGKLKEAAEPPNLIEVQINSYIDFLQQNVLPARRKDTGLQAVFREVFPITSYDEKVTLDFVSYEIGEPKLSALESQREGQTFSAPAPRDVPTQGGKGHQGGESVHGRNPAHDPAGHVCHQRRGARRGFPIAPFARHLFRVVHPPERQGALQFPHHPRPRLVA